MEGIYIVRLGGQAAGKVQVTREGLYYRFYCRCRLSGDVVCRVMIHCGSERESLGVLTPDGDGFMLSTRIPVKRFREGTPEFVILPSRPERQVKFVPVYPEEPFTYLQRLKDAYLAMENGQVGVMIHEAPGS